MISRSVPNFTKLPKEMQEALLDAEHSLLQIARSLAYHQAHSDTARSATAALQEYTSNG